MEPAAVPQREVTPPVVVQQRLVVFDADGMPMVTTTPYIPKAKIQQLALQALSLPYTSANDELAIELGLKPSDYYGRPLVEVMLVKAALGAAQSGDIDQIEKILDRAIGKPKTSSENVNINGSYEDFLKSAGDLMKARPPRSADGPLPVHDAEVVHEPEVVREMPTWEDLQ